MKKIYQYDLRRALAVLATGLLLGGGSGTAARAADMYRMPLNAGGGIPAQTTINITDTLTNTIFSWYGMRGWSTVEATTNLTDWFPYASTEATEYAWSVTTPKPTGSYMFRLAQTNYYAGSDACSSCHGANYSGWRTTAHSTAIKEILNTNGSFLPFRSAACLPCHTVGSGQPTGYAYNTNGGSANYSSYLANVGCENCHGTAGWHKGSDHAAIRPAVSIDPAICGSCHQGSHHPTYEEYIGTKHAQVNDDVKYGFNSGVYYTNTITLGGTNLYGYYVTTNADLTLKTNATSGIVSSLNGPQSLPNLAYAMVYDLGEDRAASCGVCHSGATRMAMLYDYDARLAGRTNALQMASGTDAGAWGPTCAVCHDPHTVKSFPLYTMVTNIIPGVSTNFSMVVAGSTTASQLRYPTWSSNYFTMPTTTDKRTILTTNYNGSVTTSVAFYGTPFASYNNPNINVCGQCHNTRGARWDGLGFGLLTNTVIGGPVTNVVYVDVVTWVTNIQVFTNSIPWVTNTYVYSYVSGRSATNVVTASVTNKVITAGLTTNVTGYSRAPHNSVQYNILIGILQPDYLNTTNGKTVYTNGVLNNGLGIYATHSGIASRSVYNTNQCATCHVPRYSVDANNTVTGHTFDMDTHNCTLCHSSGTPDIEGYQTKTTNNIVRVVDLLNRWATNNAPAILGANYSKYKLNSWEFTLPGLLATVTNAGPSSSDQLKLPAAIRQARFNTYMVRNDGSLGVHNPTFISLLLSDAEAKVLSQFTTAKFTANTPDLLVGKTITFTNLNPNVTACTWAFGDSLGTSTSTAATVTYTYTTVGTYSVTLTATDSNGTETMTRNNYVTTYALPVPSYTSTPGPFTAPATVNFTNTSLNAGYSRWSFYDSSGSLSSSHRITGIAAPTAAFTYTNAGTYKIVFQAANAGGSVNMTNSITVN